MITLMDYEDKMKETEKFLDSQLWHACAGNMVQMTSLNSEVFYFPQGHSEHASSNVDFTKISKIPSYILCRVSSIKYMADLETDEVFAKIRLVPIRGNEFEPGDGSVLGINGSENQEKVASFAKTLTQSDANNGGGFSVPRYCAETIFPRLDYTADPPVQNILVKDVHGETWMFRHIYRGTPRRHLLTTGWSAFVNHKKLVAGDSIVFLRTENGDLCIGIRRAKRGIGGGPEMPSRWNPISGNCFVQYRNSPSFMTDGQSTLARNDNGIADMRVIGRDRVKAEDVIEAARLAASEKPFNVVYYPRAGTPEFCVKASLVNAAMQVRWCSGMKFKMAFETEDSSRISWFMGTISSVQVADPVRWPDSPWRLLLVSWDEPDLLQNVKRVNPWLVELVPNTSMSHLSSFSPPQKKPRLLQHPEFPFLCHQLVGCSNPFGCLLDHTPAGMQGARHAEYGLSLSSLDPNKLQSVILSLDRASVPFGTSNFIIPDPRSDENVLIMGNSSRELKKSNKEASFVLFGQPILTEKQISMSCSSANDALSPMCTGNSSSDRNGDKMGIASDGFMPSRIENEGKGFQVEFSLETGHCKVFMESEVVGRILDLSLVSSYEDLYKKLAILFDMEILEIQNNVVYHDGTGAAKKLGDESFSNFLKTAKRLTIVADSSRDNVEE